VEGQRVAGDFDVRLVLFVELAATIAVPEVSDVAELLRLTDRELAHVVAREVFAERVIDGRWIDQEVLRELQVAVVLHHAAEVDVRAWPAIELGERICFEGLRELDRSITAEVEEDHGGTVANWSDRLSVGVDDDERGQVLVVDARLFVAERQHRL